MEHVSRRKGRKLSLLLLTLMAFQAGCFSTKRPTPRFYTEARFINVGGQDAEVAFDLHIASVPAPPPATVAKLPERAVASLIEAYAADPALRNTIPALLAAPIQSSPATALFDDSLVRFKKRFTFTIVPLAFHPADRIYSATLKAVAPDGWRFTGWSGFDVKERAIKIATIESVLSRKQGASVKLAAPQIAELAEAGVSTESARTDGFEQELGFEVVEFLPRLNDKTAELTLHAPFPQINLAGSYSVDIALEFKNPRVQQFVQFKFDADRYIGHSIRGLRFVPDVEMELPLETLELKYIERTVYDPEGGPDQSRTGAATPDEGDDRATYRQSDARALTPPRLFDEGELTATVDVAMWDENKPVFFYDHSRHTKRENAICLAFRSGDEALRFADWIRVQTPEDRVVRRAGNRVLWELLLKDGEVYKRLDGSKLNEEQPFSFGHFKVNDSGDRSKLVEIGCGRLDNVYAEAE